jgi:hypothetical protein
MGKLAARPILSSPESPLPLQVGQLGFLFSKQSLDRLPLYGIGLGHQLSMVMADVQFDDRSFRRSHARQPALDRPVSQISPVF